MGRPTPANYMHKRAEQDFTQKGRGNTNIQNVGQVEIRSLVYFPSIEV